MLPIDTQASTPLPQQPAPAPAASNPDPVETASQLLKVGDQWGTDDYDARAQAFGEAIQQGDTEYKQALVSELLKQDANAFNSWMTPTRINALVDDGKVPATARGDMAEAIAGAYNAGQLPSHEMRDSNGEAIGTENALDTYLHNPNSTSNDPVDKAVETARNSREFAEFFAGPTYSSEVSAFRENYSNHLIKDYALNGKIEDGNLRNLAATQAASVLNGDPTRGDIAANVLSGLDQGQVNEFMERVANGSEQLSARYLEGIVPNSTVALRDGLQASDLSLPDQFSSLVAQVSRIDSPAAQDAAVKLAGLPAAKADVFDDRSAGYQDRVDAMGQLFSAQSKPILDHFTDYNTDKIGSKDDADLKQYMQSSSDLGSLFNVVLFNKDATFSGVARQEVLDYATGLKSQINTDAGNADALGRLSMLMGSADDAITQGFNDLKAKDDAQGELVSFVVDLALAGIPVGDKLKGSVATALGDVFSNPKVTEALKGVTGDLIDSGTGKLTDAAKEALTGALGADETELLDQQGASNALRNALMSGIDNQRDLAAIENYSEDVSQGINLWRK